MDFGAGVAVAVIVPLVLTWLTRRSAQATHAESAGALVFPGAPHARVLVRGSVVLFTAAAIGSVFVEGGMEWWVTALFIGFASLGVVGEIPVLTIDDGGVSSRAWYSKKRLAWADLVRLELNAGNRTFTVRSKDGATIACSGFHAGAGRFCDEVLARSMLPLFLETPGVIGMNTSELPNAQARTTVPRILR